MKTTADRSSLRETWIIQAYVLFEYFAIFSCKDDLFSTALSIHRKLVDAIRHFQLLQDVTSEDCDSVENSFNQYYEEQIPDTPMLQSSEYRWRKYVENENRKRYAFFSPSVYRSELS